MESDETKKKKSPACPRCGNRLRLRADQVGTQIMCPGSRAASSSTSDASSAEDDAYEPEIPLVRSAAVPDEGVVDLSPSANRQTGYEVDWDTTEELEVELPQERRGAEPDHLAEARGLVRREVLPDLPKWTFFSNVFTYPWQGVNLSRWTAMAFGLSMTGMAFLKTAELLGLLSGGLTDAAIQGILLAMMTIVLALSSLSFCAASSLAAIQDTADGYDEAQESSLPDWDQWVFTFVGMFTLWAGSAALGFPLSLLEPIGPAASLISSVVLFPVLLLSAMEADSFFMPLSLPVLGTLTRCWRAWGMFYLLTTAMLVGWIAALGWALPLAPYLTLLFNGPVVAAMMLVYSRLLGRVAWSAGGGAAHSTQRPDDKSDAKQPAKGKPARRGRRAVMPADLDAARELFTDDRPESGPRINFRHRP